MTDISLITDIGRAKLNAAAGDSSAVEITHAALGTGEGGAFYDPAYDQTALGVERLRQAVSERVELGGGSWLIRAVFAAETIPTMNVREIGFFDADGDLIVIVAGKDFQQRRLGGFDYILEQTINFNRDAETVIVDAPDWHLFDHAVLDLQKHAIIATEQFTQRLLIRDLQTQLDQGAAV